MGSGVKKKLTVTIPLMLADKVDVEAHKKGVHKSDIVRLALEDYLSGKSLEEWYAEYKAS